MLKYAALLIALIPGLYAWWQGKRLLRSNSDPLLAERLLAYRGNVLRGLFLAMAAVWWLDEPKLMLLAAFGAFAGGFPSRKVLFGETWSFAGYSQFWLRIVLAFRGLHYLLFFTPLLVAAADQWRWPVIGFLALLMFGWVFFGLQVFFTLLRAKPLADFELKTRFEALAERSTIPQPLLMCAAFPGGRFANAFAMPAVPQPAVIFTQTLLDELQAEEAGAIFAHELAHLEHMDARFVKRGAIITGITIVLALLAAPLAEMYFGAAGGSFWVQLLMGAVLVLGLHLCIGHRQHHETDSDRRAVEICGDAETLARALERLHELSHLPRRWNEATEKASSHPSLANRIRAIRSLDNSVRHIESGSMPMPVLLTSIHPGRFVILDVERIHWLEGVPENAELELSSLRERAASVSSLAYSELRELLLKPSGQQGAILSAMTRKGQIRKFALRDEDIATAQHALDCVDTKLVQKVDAGYLQEWLIRIYCLGLVALVYWATIWAVTSLVLSFIALFCIVRPRLYTLAALALSAFGTGLIVLVRRPPLNVGEWFQIAVLLGLAVAALAYISRRKGNEIVEARRDLWWLTAVLIFVSAIAWYCIGSAVADDLSALRLHQVMRDYPSAVTGLLGLAGLTAVAGRKRWRVPIAMLLCIAAVIPLGVQSSYFGLQLANDPFAALPAPLHWQSAELKPVRQIALERNASGLRLSPHARWFAYHSWRNNSNDSAARGRIVVADFGGKKTELVADSCQFVDEDRLLVLNSTSETRNLQLWTYKQDAWAMQKQWLVPEMVNAQVDLNRASGQWRVMGHSKKGAVTITVTGALNMDPVSIREFPPIKGFKIVPFDVAVGDSVLNMPMIYPRHSPWFYAIGAYREFRLSRGDADWRKITTTARSGVSCLSTPPGAGEAEPVTCILQESNTTDIGWLHLDTREVDPLLRIPDTLGSNSAARDNGHLYLPALEQKVYAIDPLSRRAFAFDLPGSGYYPHIAVSEPWLAVLSEGTQDDAQIQLFKLPGF